MTIFNPSETDAFEAIVTLGPDQGDQLLRRLLLPAAAPEGDLGRRRLRHLEQAGDRAHHGRRPPAVQGSRMKGYGPVSRSSLKKPVPAKPRFFRPMPERAEPISARD